MSREGRSQPVQPVAQHGFVDPGPGPVGTTPARPQAVENFADPRRRITPQPLVLSGVLALGAPSVVLPALPTVVELVARRSLTPLPIVLSGVLGFSVAAPADTPPPPTVVENDTRRKLVPQPIALSGVLAPVTAPVVLPPTPFVVPLAARARLLELPVSLRGFDDVMPPQPKVVGPATPYPRTPVPISISGALAPFLPPFTRPPLPLVVIVDGQRRLVPQPIVLAGRVFPPVVVGAIYTEAFGPPSPDANELAGTPSSAGLDGELGANTLGGELVGSGYGPPSPGRA